MDTRGRDRFVDLLRGGSIVAVVVGHWLVADLRWTADAGGALRETSALAEVPGMWPLTWLLVVIPLFFFVGGYANRRSWEGTVRRGEGYAAFVDRRVHRVLAPSGVYVALIAAAGLAIDRIGGLGIRAMGGLFYQPLWFLGAYLWVVALVPLTLAAHQRFGVAVPLLLGGLVVLGDLGRFGAGVSATGYANVLWVWLLMHQMGYFLVDGRLRRPVAATMALGGLISACLVVLLGPYSATMVGVPGGAVGNMHPPTLAIACLGFAQIGVAMLARGPLDRWVARPRVWAAVIAVNLSVVSIYLWHQAALTLTARLVLPLGYPEPAPGTLGWWLARGLWLLVPGAVLAGIVAVVGRAERVAAPLPIAPARWTAATAVVGVVLVGLGYLALAGSSATEPFALGESLGPVTATPLLGLALLAGGWALFAGMRRFAGSGHPVRRRRAQLGADPSASVTPAQ